MKSILLQATALAAATLLAVALLLWLTAGSGRMPVLPTVDAEPLERHQPGEPLVLSWDPIAGADSYVVEIIEASTGFPALSGRTAGTRWTAPPAAADLLDREKQWLWRVTPEPGE